MDVPLNCCRIFFFFFEVYIIIYYMDLLQEDSLKQPSWTMNLNSIHFYVTSAFQKKKKILSPVAVDIVDVKIFSFSVIIPTNSDVTGAELRLENHYFRPWGSFYVAESLCGHLKARLYVVRKRKTTGEKQRPMIYE